jgi:hypothetical protein
MIRFILSLIGCLAILMGVSTGLYSYFILRPKVAAVSEQTEKTLATLESASQNIESHTPLFVSLHSATVRGVQSSSQMMELLPSTLTALRGTLIESSGLLETSSKTTKEAKEGVSGLVLPKKELTANMILLGKTASQLRLMAAMVDKLNRASVELASSAKDISNQFSDLKPQLGFFIPLLQNTRSQIRTTQEALHSLSLPTHTMLAGALFGGLYILLGFLTLSLAAIYGRIAKLNQLLSIPTNSDASATSARRAA